MSAERGRYTVEVEASEALAAAWAAKAAESDAEPLAEVPAAEPPAPPPASAPKAEHAAYVADALGVPAAEAEQMKKADLVELARLAASG